MINMKVSVAGVEFKNPVIAASGTFGFGKEFASLYDLSVLGGISLKGLTVERREGNAPPRIAETPSGMLNSVGLQNPGAEYFVRHDLPELRKYDTKLIANINGNTAEDYCRVAEIMSAAGVDMLELNISCPNVKCGGMAFGVKPESVLAITKTVKPYCRKPLIVKLSPNVADITENARAAEEGGADAIALINTVSGMAVDAYSMRPVLANVKGGLSGPAVKPIALRMVYDCHNAVRIPIIGMGGITSGTDVAEFMLCGASAVQVGAANIMNPMAMPEIISRLANYLTEMGIDDINSLVGALKV